MENPYKAGTKKALVFDFVQSAGEEGVTRSQLEEQFGSYGFQTVQHLKNENFVEHAKVECSDPRVRAKINIYRLKTEEMVETDDESFLPEDEIL